MLSYLWLPWNQDWWEENHTRRQIVIPLPILAPLFILSLIGFITLLVGFWNMRSSLIRRPRPRLSHARKSFFRASHQVATPDSDEFQNTYLRARRAYEVFVADIKASVTELPEYWEYEKGDLDILVENMSQYENAEEASLIWWWLAKEIFDLEEVIEGFYSIVHLRFVEDWKGVSIFVGDAEAEYSEFIFALPELES